MKQKNNYFFKLFVFMTLLFFLNAKAIGENDPQAFVIFDAQGKPVTLEQMINTISTKQVVFFGEMHNCPICHWLEFEVAKRLYDLHKFSFVMGAEMFESDNQLILDEFLQSRISEKSFESEMRLWDNYSTDYVKLIDFAKENNIPFVASNIPRRYAQLVSRKGLNALDSISSEAKRFIPPLPIPYKTDTTATAMFDKMTALMGTSSRNSEFMAQAQAVKDATMAWKISRSLLDKDVHFLHFNGSFHSDNKEGIIPFLIHYAGNIRLASISCCRQESLEYLEEENVGRGDFIICVPADMVNSY